MSEEKKDLLDFIDVKGNLDLAKEEHRLIDKFMRSIQPELMELGETGFLAIDDVKREVVATSLDGKTKKWNLDVELNKIRESEKVIH